MTLEVIGAGFARTGTLSLQQALDHLGFGPTYHMVDVVGQGPRGMQARMSRPRNATAQALADEGLGLDYNLLRLDRTTEGWVTAGASLRDEVADRLQHKVVAVEQIGSSAVVGLLAKPIVDLAVGVTALPDVDAALEALKGTGWIYRGDAGDSGGHVCVLETRPWYRVAHIHIVEHGKSQWLDYLLLRDLLRQSPEARERYEAVKKELVDEPGYDRRAYTDAKSQVVRSLLDDAIGL